MKDLRKVKNKYLFEFNNKQMTLIFTGLLVIGLLVFAAGAMVGSRMAQSKVETEPRKDFSAKIKAPSLLKEKAEAKEDASPSIEDVIKQTQDISPVKKEEGDEPGLKKAKPKKGDATAAKVKKEAAKKQVATEKPAKTKAYFVQVAAFRDLKDAEKRVKDLSKKGYKAIVVTAEIPGKGTWHRVRFGPFENLEKSKSFALNFEKKERISTFITSN